MLSTQHDEHLRTVSISDSRILGDHCVIQISELQYKNDQTAQSTPVKSPSTPTLDTPSKYITLAPEPHGQEFEVSATPLYVPYSAYKYILMCVYSMCIF